ncbi:MAG TPA: ComF family protein [Candidatus Gracilibacteria bacterium]
MKISSKLQKLKPWLQESLAPTRCLISGKLDHLLGTEYQDFPRAPENQVQYQYLDQIYARTKYYHPVTEKIVEYFKFRQYQSLAPIMAQLINEQFPKDFIQAQDIFIPIPLHWRRWLFRGYNQSLILAKAIQKFYPQNEINHSLRRVRYTSQQARLNRDARHQNLAGAFAWRGDQVPKSVILIDDVVASGSTLEAAARVLKQAGVQTVKAVAFARGGK